MKIFKEIINAGFLIPTLLFLSLPLSSLTLDRQIPLRYILLASTIILSSTLFLINTTKQIMHVSKKAIYPFLILILFILVSSFGLLYTNNISDGIFIVSKLILFASSIFLVFITVNDKDFLLALISKIIPLLGIIICSIAFIQIIQTFNKGEISHSSLYNVTATLGHKNLLSEYIFLLLPFTIFSVFYSKKFWKIISITSSVSIIILITLLMTRSAWVASFSSTILLLLISIYTKLVSKKILKKNSQKNYSYFLPFLFFSNWHRWHLFKI